MLRFDVGLIFIADGRIGIGHVSMNVDLDASFRPVIGESMKKVFTAFVESVDHESVVTT